MRSSRDRCRSRTEDATSRSIVDLFMAFGGVTVVLLLAALMAMGVPEVPLSVLGEERERRQAAEIIAAEAERKAEEFEAVSNMRRRRPTKVCLAVDATGSMKSALDEVETLVRSLAIVGPHVAPSFELCIVAYRSDLYVFPLTKMDAAGVRSLQRYLDRKQTGSVLRGGSGENGVRTGEEKEFRIFGAWQDPEAAPDEGIRRALRELGDPEPGGNAVLAIIGDCGPYQRGKSDAIEPSEIALAKALTGEVQTFAGAEGASVVAVFLSKHPQMSIEVRSASEEFFHDLAGEDGEYAERVSAITSAVVQASLIPGQSVGG